jgi:hypothetical protein
MIIDYELKHDGSNMTLEIKYQHPLITSSYEKDIPTPFLTYEDYRVYSVAEVEFNNRFTGCFYIRGEDVGQNKAVASYDPQRYDLVKLSLDIINGVVPIPDGWVVHPDILRLQKRLIKWL